MRVSLPIYEIICDGKVHYRRLWGHKDILEAWRTPGYPVRKVVER